jgi:predicted ATPase
VLIHSLRPSGVLSFGPDTEAIPLHGLNVIIGPNGSGKSNLLEVIALLKSASKAMAEPVREGGGIREWLWKGSSKPMIASLEAKARWAS